MTFSPCQVSRSLCVRAAAADACQDVKLLVLYLDGLSWGRTELTGTRLAVVSEVALWHSGEASRHDATVCVCVSQCT